MSYKRNVFYDYLRVLSVLLVITSHYAYMFDVSDILSFPRTYLTGGIGRLGVSFFFMISGGMAYLSLKKYSTKIYYFRRVISILVPYNVVYLLMAILLIILAQLYHVDYPRNPLEMLWHGDRTLWEWLPSFVGFDHYLHGVYDIDTLYFTGEWFIGCIIILYILAPLLFRMLNDSPLLALVFVLLISLISYDRSGLNPYWSASTRLADFMFGMFFIRYYTHFEKHKKWLALGANVCVLMGGLYALWTSIDLREVLFPLSPQSLFFSVSLFVLIFCGYCYSPMRDSSRLQRGIQALAGRAYIIMLLQHVVIITISSNIDMSALTGLHAFGYYLVILAICERLSVVAKIATSWSERELLMVLRVNPVHRSS